jgi:replicative DNA helicase
VSAEQCVLGGMLLSRDAIGDVVDIIGPDAHYRPAHQIIHEIILDVYGKGQPVDAITIANELGRRDLLGRIGEALYLHTLIAAVPTAANAGHYAHIVREHAEARQVIEAGMRITQIGYAPDGGGQDGDRISTAQAVAYGLTGRAAGSSALPVAELLPAALDRLEALGSRSGELTGVPTGLVDLDALTGGFQAGQLVIGAARPAIGKSTLALGFALEAVRQGIPTVVFSLEMDRTEILFKALSAEARVPLHLMRAGKLGDAEWERLARRMSELSDRPLFIDDSPSLNLMEIRAKCQHLKTREDLGFVIVDYLQLMRTGGSHRYENRQVEVSEMSRSLKMLAKELRVPVLALSQLNRGPEQRHDKKPMLSDLRESGSIEMDADIVILLHREDAYDRESPRAGEADLIVAKHRNGPTATITAAFQGHYSRFVDMSPAG